MSGEVDLCGWWTDLRDSSSVTMRPSILISENWLTYSMHLDRGMKD